MDSTFNNIDIVKYLKNKNSIFYGKICEIYNLANRLLSQIPIAFPNYTLHDIDHSIRVIQYMNEFVKKDLDKFSELHLALIVYVGLLHDTGMVVPDSEIAELFEKFSLINNEFSKLSDEAKYDYLKDYIRKNHGNRVSKVFNYRLNGDADIASLFYVGETNTYSLTTLISKLCQSHTESCTWITEQLDSVKYIAGYTINPQHIAILLRLGDVLDIDDRRAPWMLYKLINPRGISDIEWRKHIPITNYEKVGFINNEYTLMFSGECDDPEIHREILKYTDWINLESKSLNRILSDFNVPYRFKLKTPIEINIQTIGFVDTPLRFNLKYEQISKLLMGEKIYGSKRDGLRELLQNAIDTVRLVAEKESKNAHSVYVPAIGIEINEDKNQFVVFDNGNGMTQEILEEYFFNIGNSFYVSEEFRKEMYSYNPIGHFGIGFLSCFMLSSKVVLETKDYKSSSIIKMEFDKESPYVTMYENQTDDFPYTHGTKIIMDYDQIFPEVFQDTDELLVYLQELLITEGYKFLFINNNEKSEVLNLKPSKSYQIEDGNIELEFELMRLPSIKFDIFNFFEDNELVYLLKQNKNYVDEDDINSLAYLEESVNDFDMELQIHDGNVDEAVSSCEERLYVLPEVLIDAIIKNKKRIKEMFLNNDSIYGGVVEGLSEIIKNGVFVWYDIPVFEKANSFFMFLDDMENLGYDVAYANHIGEMKIVSIISDEEVTGEIALCVAEKYLSLVDCDYSIDYYLSYPIEPIRKSVDLLQVPNSTAYALVNDNYILDESFTKVFLKGIRVNDRNIMLPHIINDTRFVRMYVNINSNAFDTDISRMNFDKNSKEALAKHIAIIVYEELLKNPGFSNDELELIKIFMEKYYL